MPRLTRAAPDGCASQKKKRAKKCAHESNPPPAAALTKEHQKGGRLEPVDDRSRRFALFHLKQEGPS
jgi:hypothetical protein